MDALYLLFAESVSVAISAVFTLWQGIRKSTKPGLSQRLGKYPSQDSILTKLTPCGPKSPIAAEVSAQTARDARVYLRPWLTVTTTYVRVGLMVNRYATGSRQLC